MRRWLGSLQVRISAIFLFGLFAVQVAILLAALWPDGRPLFFRLVDPRDAREIAEAIEAAPRALRPAIVSAASNGGTTVEILAGFPAEGAGAGSVRPAPHLEERFRRFSSELRGRPLRVQTRDGTLFARPLQAGATPRGPVRILVGLRTGEVLAIERAPRLLQLLADRYMAVAIVVAVILLAMLLTLSRQVLRPLERLARASEAFGQSVDAPDAVVGGARELKALASAFNAMKARIGGLVGERTHMLAAIAHDLRTYLTRLRLRADHIGDARHRARAIDDIDEMRLLLDDILLFARSDAGADESVALIDARTEAVAYVSMRRDAGDEVAVAAQDAGLLCRCGPLAFRRILGNLIDNAIRYGGRADVAVERQDDKVAIVVRDNGPGIPDALIARLTEPFTRLETSRGRHSGGAGLGLSIVKALAEAHGGTLHLANRSHGGLRAIVRLPAEAVSQA
jgi:two-component system, OmpR family, osmolarity sensor histidine kinase EnvZ